MFHLTKDCRKAQGCDAISAEVYKDEGLADTSSKFYGMNKLSDGT